MFTTGAMEPEKFCLDDYDCIGFDLDCTLAEYRNKELMKLEYDLLAKFLIEKKFYSSEFILKPFDEGKYFLQKGLFMDFKKGNILKISKSGEIVKATHGTRPLTENDIIKVYGPSKTLEAFQEFVKDPLSIINTPYEKIIRTSLDCFDMPCVLLFARLVDQLDHLNGCAANEYKIWPDILEGLYHLYTKSYFATGESGFFSALQENASLYYDKWNLEKINWLKEVKKKKFTFMLTGSFIDFARLTSTSCIGENWRDYFDVILCFARKPFFFTSNRPFFYVENDKETVTVAEGALETNNVYSQGNWKELQSLISKHTNIKDPKCLYIGDNMIQDIYSPDQYKCCDTVAVLSELKSEFEYSELWGSFFEGEDGNISYWNNLIKCHAKICVSDLDALTKRPLNYQYFCLKADGENEISESSGYYYE